MTYSPCPLHEAARKYGPEVAIANGRNLSITYDELNTIVECAREALAHKGLKAGDRIGLHMQNNLDQVTILLALFRLKVVACPLNPKLPVEVAASLMKEINGTLMISESADECQAASMPVLRLCDLDLQAPEHFIEDSEPGVHQNAMATIIFTSGSSGIPRAAAHSLSNHVYSALGANSNIPIERGDRYILSLPLCHVAGLSVIFRCMLAGATLFIPDPKKDLGQVLQECNITHVSMVVPQLYRLLQNSDFSKLTLKAILLGGSAIPGSLIRQAIQKGLPVHISYGSTETASQAVASSRVNLDDDLGSSGKVLPYREVKISSEGEVLIRGKTLFLGYLKDGILSRPVDKEGWFATGDLGVMDKSGSLFILGRRDNMFISGGENIYPEEVEKILCELNEIQQAVVVSVPDTEFGHRAVAFLKAGDVGVSLPDLKKHLLKKLPSYKVPRSFLEWPEGADTEEMKIDRNLFKSLAEQRTCLG